MRRSVHDGSYKEMMPVDVKITNVIDMRDKELGCYVNVEGYRSPVLVLDDEWTPKEGEVVIMRRPVDDYFYVQRKEE